MEIQHGRRIFSWRKGTSVRRPSPGEVGPAALAHPRRKTGPGATLLPAARRAHSLMLACGLHARRASGAVARVHQAAMATAMTTTRARRLRTLRRRPPASLPALPASLPAPRNATASMCSQWSASEPPSTIPSTIPSGTPSAIPSARAPQAHPAPAKRRSSVAAAPARSPAEPSPRPAAAAASHRCHRRCARRAHPCTRSLAASPRPPRGCLPPPLGVWPPRGPPIWTASAFTPMPPSRRPSAPSTRMAVARTAAARAAAWAAAATTTTSSQSPLTSSGESKRAAP